MPIQVEETASDGEEMAVALRRFIAIPIGFDPKRDSPFVRANVGRKVYRSRQVGQKSVLAV